MPGTSPEQYEDVDDEFRPDALLENADWTKKTWDLPVGLVELDETVPDAERLLDLPAGQSMPRRLRSKLENRRGEKHARARREDAATLGEIQEGDRYRGH